MIKIGILGHGLIGWGGGIDFLAMICESLLAQTTPVELHLLLPTKGPLYRAQVLLADTISYVRSGTALPNQLVRERVSGLVRQLELSVGEKVSIHEIDVGPLALRSAAHRYRLQVLLPSGKPLANLVGVPWIGYLPDFQFMALPHFFSEKEISVRKINARSMLSKAKIVIVNAREVERDALNFLPSGRSIILSLPFSAAPKPSWLLPPTVGPEDFGVRDRYFIVCNQFWRHKDHLTAFRALSMLPEEFRSVEMICTGDTADFRDPGYFESVRNAIIELGLQDRIKVVGNIPKLKQVALLKQSVALVQPTLFEGGPGGGATYDALAIGVPALLSDIAVNLEISYENNVQYFKVGNAVDLAQKMVALLRQQRREELSTAHLAAKGAERRRACGEKILEAIRALRVTPSAAGQGTSSGT